LPQPPAPRVALVHDFLLDLRGAERVLLALCDIFPDADLFTAVYDEVGTEGRFAHRRVRTSFLQRLRPDATSFRRYLPLYPYAMEALDLSGYDLVLSSSSAWAHGVVPEPETVHVCYCHNPFRYAWNARQPTLRTQPPFVRAMLGVVLQRWRQWDWIAAQRVDRYIANSETTRRRIARYFTRDAEVIYPPVEIERFAPMPVGEHYVVLSELMAHKRLELAVRAFNDLRRPLVVIGDGPDGRRLRRLAGPTVQFTGRVSDAEVASLVATARAMIVTATEEFGIAAVEAQAAGRPVIALDEGGVTESVVEGETGTFYATPDHEALAAAVAGFDALAVDPAVCIANAQRFSRTVFAERIRAVAEEALAAGPSPRADRRRSRGLALAGRRAA